MEPGIDLGEVDFRHKIHGTTTGTVTRVQFIVDGVVLAGEGSPDSSIPFVVGDRLNAMQRLVHIVVDNAEESLDDALEAHTTNHQDDEAGIKREKRIFAGVSVADSAATITAATTGNEILAAGLGASLILLIGAGVARVKHLRRSQTNRHDSDHKKIDEATNQHETAVALKASVFSQI